ARDHYARMLAQQILEIDLALDLLGHLRLAHVDPPGDSVDHGAEAHADLGPPELGWQGIEEGLAIREAMTPDATDAAIAEAVEAELARIRLEIGSIVRRKIESAIDRAIDERVGSGPKVLAKRVVDKMWE